MWIRLFPFAAGVAVAAGVLLGGCASATSQPAAGTITGTFRMSVGVIALPDGGAVPGRVTATNRHGQAFSTAVPASGRFRLHVPPGTYALVGRSPKFVSDGTSAPCGAGPVTVGSGRVVGRDVICQGP